LFLIAKVIIVIIIRSVGSIIHDGNSKMIGVGDGLGGEVDVRENVICCKD